jgi:hypothetical protein
MNEPGKQDERAAQGDSKELTSPPLVKKKRKTEPEVIIAPTRPGGPDITLE